MSITGNTSPLLSLNIEENEEEGEEEEEEEEVKTLTKSVEVAKNKFLDDFESLVTETNKRSEALLHSFGVSVVTLQRVSESYTQMYNELIQLDERKHRELNSLRTAGRQSMQNWVAQQDRLTSEIRKKYKQRSEKSSFSLKKNNSSSPPRSGEYFLRIIGPPETPSQEDDKKRRENEDYFFEGNVSLPLPQTPHSPLSFHFSSPSSSSSSLYPSSSSDFSSSSSSSISSDDEDEHETRDPWYEQWTDEYDMIQNMIDFEVPLVEKKGSGKYSRERKRRKIPISRDACLLRATPYAVGPYLEWMEMDDNAFLSMLQTAYTRYISSTHVSGKCHHTIKDPEQEDILDYGGWRGLVTFDIRIGYIDDYCLYCQQLFKNCSCSCFKGHSSNICCKELHNVKKEGPYLGCITTVEVYNAVKAIKTPPPKGEDPLKWKEKDWDRLHDLLRSFLLSDRMCKIMVDLIVFNAFAKSRWRRDESWKKPRCPICRFRTNGGNTAHTLCHACRSTGCLKNRWAEYGAIAEPLKQRVIKLNKTVRSTSKTK